MTRRARRTPRGWEFWRKAFWTRPALLVVYGLGAGLLGLAMLATVPGDIHDAAAMRGAPDCPAADIRPRVDADPPRGCLERVPVVLSGPWYRRGPGSSWHFKVEDGARQVFYAKAGVPASGSARLTDGMPAVLVLWEGDPVAVDLSDGQRVQTDNWGQRGWLLYLFLGLFTVSGLPMLLDAAGLKRRTTGGWWSVRGEPVGPLRPLTPLMSVACLMAGPAMLGFLPLVIGLDPLWAVVAAVAGLGLAVLAVVKNRTFARRPRAAARPAGAPAP